VHKLLPDGAVIDIRAIRPSDKPLLVAGLRLLSDLSVYRRFLSTKRRFSKAELRYLTEVDGRDHVALVAEVPSAPDRLIGVARFVRLHDVHDTAEAAILVADDWQRRRVGSALATALGDEARARGIRRFVATIASDNVPAQRLMAKLASRLDLRHTGDGTSELVADLAA
jgi:RimJ/RimL family protein N-acetyltransferase